jgi:hypothetical protein
MTDTIESLRAQLAAEKELRLSWTSKVAHICKDLAAEKARADGESEAVRRAESAELGCDIAYRREPTQEEGDAHEDKQHQSMGPDLPTGECFVAMGGWTGRRCRHCARWVWGGPTACAVCVERASRDELGIQLAACQERLRLALAVVEAARDCWTTWGRQKVESALAALDAVPGDALSRDIGPALDRAHEASGVVTTKVEG